MYTEMTIGTTTFYYHWKKHRALDRDESFRCL